jgi:hypothetical protein
MGGDGWADNIGYGEGNHVIASGENGNIIVLDHRSVIPLLSEGCARHEVVLADEQVDQETVLFELA